MLQIFQRNPQSIPPRGAIRPNSSKTAQTFNSAKCTIFFKSANSG